jgi:hypothetical protein
MARANQLGRAVVEAFPGSASAKAYMELSQRLLGLPQEQADTQAGGVTAMVKSLLRQMRCGELAQVVN